MYTNRILRGRQIVKGVIKRCIVCNRCEGMPCLSVMLPGLPSFRVSEDPPFTHIGIDFVSPMYLREASAQDASTVLQTLTYAFSRLFLLEP